MPRWIVMRTFARERIRGPDFAAEAVFYSASGIWLPPRAGFAHVTPASRGEDNFVIANWM
jgi:hypothetical protein